MGRFEIHTAIDLHDVQGNIIKGYGRYGFPFARYVLYRVNAERAGRDFVGRLIPLITTSAPWTRYGDVKGGTKKPRVTTNIAFTYDGLKQLAVPARSLSSFPHEFSMGMRARTALLGDDGPSAPEHWDPIWSSVDAAQVAHVLITINGLTKAEVEERYNRITEALLAATADDADGVVQLIGHRNAEGAAGAYQDAAALPDEMGQPTPKEHFGFTDGISDPYFKESGSFPTYVAGGGKRLRKKPASSVKGWAPLATGEFLLGHVDEADEYPAAPIPTALATNGTFLVYRKLHQNVASFDRYVSEQGAALGDDPELLAAKLVGRWKNGAPLTTFPTKAAADAFVAEMEQANQARGSTDRATAKAATERYYALKQQLMAFDYSADLPGGRCPLGAHIRRANPRGALEFGVADAFDTPGALSNRRRIARRGLPYGSVFDRSRDDGDHGIIFMAIGASISRQYEFVQQQWMNYSNDFKLANDRDPIIGNQPPEGGRMVLPADPRGTEPPRFCTAIPRFVETRGGDYFFVPSLTALSNIAAGTIDPT